MTKEIALIAHRDNAVELMQLLGSNGYQYQSGIPLDNMSDKIETLNEGRYNYIGFFIKNWNGEYLKKSVTYGFGKNIEYYEEIFKDPFNSHIDNAKIYIFENNKFKEIWSITNNV